MQTVIFSRNVIRILDKIIVKKTAKTLLIV
jgi:hypothetical protein